MVGGNSNSGRGSSDDGGGSGGRSAQGILSGSLTEGAFFNCGWGYAAMAVEERVVSIRLK